MARLAGLEPATHGLEGRCSIQMSYRRKLIRLKNGRGREIRTPDILHPKQARYQTALYPDKFRLSSQTSQTTDNGARIIRINSQLVNPSLSFCYFFLAQGFKYYYI